MPRFFLIIFFTFWVLSLDAQRISRSDYISKYSLIAIKKMNEFGIPASITMAQACLESDDGNSDLAKEANNHFGIKCHNTWDGPKMYKDDDAKGECFRKYNSAEKSYEDHSTFLKNGRRYAFLFELKSDDYKGWAKGLKQAGYATNPKYPEMLIKIIEDNKLYELDKGNTYVKKEVKQESEVKKEKKNKKSNEPQIEITIGGRDIKQINLRNYIIAKQSDTYELLTKEFEKLSWELYKFNDVERNAVLKQGAIVYLQPKRNKAERGNETHTVKEGETLWTISQLYGIKLKALCKKNNLSINSKIVAGEILYLRKKKSVN